jgi:hypothetical protein
MDIDADIFRVDLGGLPKRPDGTSDLGKSETQGTAGHSFLL